MASRLYPRAKFIRAAVIVLAAVFASIGLVLVLGCPQLQDLRIQILPPNTKEDSRPTVTWPSRWKEYNAAAVATDAAPCGQVGANIMREGGSAVDAAIAAMLCVGVVNCHSTGVGGGHFMTIYDVPRIGGTKELNTIIARERAPAAASKDMFVTNTKASVKGGLAIAVPGEIAGFMKAHELYGKAKWSDLFKATIALCYNGFKVGTTLAAAIRTCESDIREDANLGELFLNKDGTLKQEGDLIINEKLGRTLEVLAADPEAFYSGTLADDIVADINEYDGIITLDDLSNYHPKVKPPLEIKLDNGGFRMVNPKPPSSGAVINYIFNILDGYNFDKSALDQNEVTRTYHRVMEAFKFAYAKRSDLGDEDLWNVEQVLRKMTSPEYADYIRSRINETQTQNFEYYEPSFDLVEDSGTAHLSVFGPDETAVAITSTINTYFGSKGRGSRTGIIFNNEMDDFSTPGTVNHFGVPSSPSNYIKPGKMPMSSMCPTLVLDANGEVLLATGGSGGTKITTAVAWITMHTLWFGMKAHEATDKPRLHHQLMPHRIIHEAHFDQAVLSGLEQRSHKIVNYNSYIAQVQTIENTCNRATRAEYKHSSRDRCILAVCDGRKDGVPGGF